MKTSLPYYSRFPVYSAKAGAESGFTLIALSIILTVASLIFVATLPGIQTSLKANAASVTKMHTILDTMRGYMAANGYLPCPADPTQAIGASNYGLAAVNPGSGSPGNCIGGAPSAAYADTTNHIAIGMVPVKTLGLSYADALDGYGRNITYVVDTNATATCWSSSSLTGAISVNDNGVISNTIAVLVSHGADGYGAWLPLSGNSGTASRFNNGSTDTSQAANAQVAPGGGLNANNTFVNFVRQSATSTFDDNIVYKSNLYTLNTLPASAQVYPIITPPSNGTYSTGNTLTFTIVYASAVSVTGTPRLDLSALGAGSIGTGNTAYATYQGGSGTNTLTFQYTVQLTDSAPTSGLTMNPYIDLNGGTISGGSTCFTAPSLTGVLIAATYYRIITIDHTKVGTVSNTDQSSFPVLFSGTYSYLATTAHGGMVTNTSGYDITFTSDDAGNNLLPFERESWNATTGASVFWVQVPTVSHSADTVIYLHYGNSSITTDQSSKTGTWDSNYKAVWHLDETSGIQYDSTSNSNNTSTINVTAQGSATGKIGGSDQFTGSSGNYLQVSGLIGQPASVTLSGWGKLTAAGTSGSDLVSIGDCVSILQDAPSSHDNGVFFSWSVGSGGQWWSASTPTVGTGSWNYFVYTYDNSAHLQTLYVNGVQKIQTAQAQAINYSKLGANTFIGKHGNGSGNYNYTGLIDEVHISSSARSADWIITEYGNQNAPDKVAFGASGFYTVGSQMSR